MPSTKDSGQQEGLRRAERRAVAGALADDDPGQDREHRQAAGREGQQQAEAGEHGHDGQQVAVTDQGEEPVLLRLGRSAARLRAVAAGAVASGRSTLGDRHLRRVADAVFLAALVAEGERERLRAGPLRVSGTVMATSS